MKQTATLRSIAWLIGVTGAIGTLPSLAAPQGAIQNIRKLAMEMPRIDTHAYLGGDVGKGVAALGCDGPVSDLSHFRILAEGVKGLYGIDPGPLLRRDAPAAIFEKAAALRARGARKALETALDAEHITTQLAVSQRSLQTSRREIIVAPDPFECRHQGG